MPQPTVMVLVVVVEVEVIVEVLVEVVVCEGAATGTMSSHITPCVHKRAQVAGC